MFCYRRCNFCDIVSVTCSLPVVSSGSASFLNTHTNNTSDNDIPEMLSNVGVKLQITVTIIIMFVFIMLTEIFCTVCLN